jgi:hypothetical protein
LQKEAKKMLTERETLEGENIGHVEFFFSFILVYFENLSSFQESSNISDNECHDSEKSSQIKLFG